MLFVIGLCLVAASLPDYWRRYQAQHWPVVDAQVLAVDVLKRRYKSGNMRCIQVDRAYRYRVDGAGHEGVTFDSFDTMKSCCEACKAANAFALAHPVGSTLTVAFDPQDPERSTANPDELVAWRSKVLLLYGGFLLACAFILAIYARWIERKERALREPRAS